MTKQIRIENADTSEWKVRVYVEHKDANGQWQRVKTVQADYPTALVSEYVHPQQRLVIEEFHD